MGKNRREVPVTMGEVNGKVEHEEAAQILTKQVVKWQNSNAKSVMRWEKPEGRCMKVNWDASLNLKERIMGAGIIVRDENGEALVAIYDQNANVDSPLVAECFAVRMAIELCNELNIHNVVFEGDARIVIEAVQSFEEESSVFGTLIDDKIAASIRAYDSAVKELAYKERGALSDIAI
ncbi:uncharacterized protein LOC121253353 [Juglans microcarpa x Juglans regia]|uniref:uncharacterized protein LOC121253353 n=1 Tax=Juglans microcarpa x Juglans regia TaxID=2249226 RepID=UPI001B7DD180|nr:uncharacterized protein LOC121253353 [Juglans microcarpa x Juglans regia]